MPPHIDLLDLGSAITDVFSFLAPADQHKLCRTTPAMCEWFDSAAENGSLAFFVTFALDKAAGPLRWKHATANPRGAGYWQEVNHAIPLATVTVHARNYYLSSFNTQARGKTAVQDDAIVEKANIELVDNFAFDHRLVVTGLFGICSIGDNFCRDTKASAVVFRGEGSQLRSVGSGWMTFCPNLKQIDLIGFTALKKVGDSWMTKCSKLKNVGLTGFTALEVVGDGWMHGCLSLETFNFALDMQKLQHVGHSWMSHCSALKQFGLTGLTALEVVGNDWLSDCRSLESITFSDTPNLKRVGSGWVSKCWSLKHVDLTGIKALEEVGDDWLYGCSNLESISFVGDMSKLKKVGVRWMSSCSKLKHVDLTGFTALEEVGDGWMNYCSSLEGIVFAGDMPKLKKAGYEGPESGRWLSDYLLHISKLGF